MKFIPEFLSNIDRDEKFVFRGHSNTKWELVPSIGRSSHRIFAGIIWEEYIQFEQEALNCFKLRSVPHLTHTPSSDIEWLSLMQHHGCSTRLLDFTYNPLIALFFATDTLTEGDGEVIFAEYKTIDHEICSSNVFTIDHNFIFNPKHITNRITNQSGCFLYCSNPSIPLKEGVVHKFIINPDEKYLARDELATLGISNSTIYPGLDGICKDLNNELLFNIFEKDLETNDPNNIR
jgi:Pyruvate/2-oxoacid:ferredoxin oxidoreductase delta subunit